MSLFVMSLLVMPFLCFCLGPGPWGPWGLPTGLATGVILTNAIYVVFILSLLSLLACPFLFFVWAQAPGAHGGLPTGLATGVVCFVIIDLINVYFN